MIPHHDPQHQPKGLLDHLVSVFLGAKSTAVAETIPLRDILHRIQDGTYLAAITHVREQLPHGEAAYKRAKDRLVAFTPCCALSTRERDVPWSAKLRSITGIVHFDFDKEEDAPTLKAQLASNPATVFAFISPRGSGVKAGIAATGMTTAETYKHAWQHVVQVLEARYPGLEASRDDAVSYLNALCFVSHDPDLYVQEQAVPIEVPPYVEPGPAPEPAPAEREGPSFQVVASALAAIPNVSADYDTWFRIGAALNSTGQPWARGLFDGWSQQSPKFDPREQQSTWTTLSKHRQGARRDVTIGTLFWMARQAGWQDPEAGEVINLVTCTESAEPGEPHETSSKRISSLNSLTSYPWPVLAKEALYGLAGEYVRTIAPQSEADPAALLIQFLTVFGVVVGRNRFFVVEDTRHYSNLFTVIVGQTSRARKGTSFDRILKRFDLVDPTWSRANLIKGCGSGEGLIHAVRDARWGKEAIKEKGRVIDYQEVLLDAGVDDKRGLYQTSEFSSIMAIAAREGSNLSETLRECWETGYLRNTVKTNPMTATGAHIGLIGHITLGEVRRVISTTEMGNGFANRFLWICAKRSQSLPEGGVLPSDAFAKAQPRLQKAIGFGQEEGPMRRDDAARAAWRAVYTPLADETNPLADTVLARSEAQVLRLSMLYALLDASAVIRHEHLNAALAVWRYAEESAAVIFGTMTGDRHADVILHALRDAGDEGLTKTAIIEEVFQRNVPTAEVFRALALLEHAHRIVPQTRPAKGGHGRRATVYTILGNEVNEVNEVKQNDYVSMSNDAAKANGISSYPSTSKYEVNAQSDPETSSEPPFVPDMTGVPDDGIPFTIPEKGYTTSAETPLREPGDEDDDEEGEFV